MKSMGRAGRHVKGGQRQKLRGRAEASGEGKSRKDSKGNKGRGRPGLGSRV